MKKVSILFVIIFSLSSYAYAQTITFDLPDIPNPGDTVSVPLSIVQCNLGCCQPATFQLFIEFDPQVLEPDTIYLTNPGMPFYEWSNNLQYEPGVMILTWLSFSGGPSFDPPEELCQIVFTYTNGCSDLIMTEPGGGGGNCDLIFENGSVGCTTSNNTIIYDSNENITIKSKKNKIIVQAEEPVIGDIFIYNLLGQEILTQKIKTTYKEIYINDSQSVYIVKIVTPESAFAKTIILK